MKDSNEKFKLRLKPKFKLEFRMSNTSEPRQANPGSAYPRCVSSQNITHLAYFKTPTVRLSRPFTHGFVHQLSGEPALWLRQMCFANEPISRRIRILNFHFQSILAAVGGQGRITHLMSQSNLLTSLRAKVVWSFSFQTYITDIYLVQSHILLNIGSKQFVLESQQRKLRNEMDSSEYIIKSVA